MVKKLFEEILAIAAVICAPIYIRRKWITPILASFMVTCVVFGQADRGDPQGRVEGTQGPPAWHPPKAGDCVKYSGRCEMGPTPPAGCTATFQQSSNSSKHGDVEAVNSNCASVVAGPLNGNPCGSPLVNSALTCP